MEKLNEKILNLKEDLIKDTREILQIKSVLGEEKEGMPFGEGINKALECALDICSKMGFKTVNLDGRVGYAEYGEGEDYVAVLGHLDVVPEGDGWIYPPYAAEIAEGRIYARGSLDDKGPMMAALYGLRAIKECNLKLSKRVRIIFGTAEETGGYDIPYYNEREKAPVAGFTPDAEFPIIFAEKGMVTFKAEKALNTKNTGKVMIKSIKGGNRVNMVPDYCEAHVNADEETIKALVEDFNKSNNMDVKYEKLQDGIAIKTFGISAHGATPHKGVNAIMKMFKFIETLPLGEDDILAYAKFFNKHFAFETDGKSAGIALSDEPSGHLTVNIGTISLENDRVSLGINTRFPVTLTFDHVLTPLRKIFDPESIEIASLDLTKPLYYPKDHELIQTLKNVYEDVTGEEGKLLAIGGGTYAKSMPNIVGFGPIFPGMPDLDHQPNEYIEIDKLITSAKIYANAIYKLAE